MNRTTVETIKQKLSIESVVGSYVKLERAGKNFRACCPFHNEKTPSFQVTPDLGIYYCFGCHKGGDIFSFVQEIEGVSFVEAKKMLAEKAGVPLDDYQNERPSRASVLREIMDSAAKHYEVGLRTTPAVVEYLTGRGMTKDTMVAFRVGYSQKGWSNLYDYLKKKKYSDEDILATGLCLKGQQAGLYDRFRERIMFPICDSQGRVIAFTGRVMPGTEESERPVGKYINSPETDLYHKSSVLFAFDKAKSAIHSEGFVIIVEGQMDAVMSHQAGVTNVVALSGTAATDEHMNQIARFTDKVAICLDADTAGLAAAQKTAIVAYAHGMKVLVIDLPNSKDPADLIRESSDEWKNAIRHRKDMVTFRLEKMRQNNEMDRKISIAEKELFPLLVHLTSQIALDDKLQEIAHAFGSSTVIPVREEFEKFMKRNPTAQAATKPGVQKNESSPQEKLVERMIGMLTLLETDESFPMMKDSFERNVGAYEELVLSKPETERKILAVKIEGIPSARAFDDLVIRYQLLDIEREKQQLDKRMLDDPHDAEILQKVHELLMRKDALTRSLVNQ